MGWEYLGILLLISALLCVVGFYKYIYFISIGYGFAVAGIGAILLVFSGTDVFSASLGMTLLCLLLILYGIRLSGFLLIREYKNTAYKKTLKEATNNGEMLSLGASFGIWIGASLLYVLQTSPVFFRLYNGGRVSGFVWAGILICTVALILESEADRQKSSQKKSRPDMVAMKGLYRFVRCPNYFGELLFWTGILVSGLDTYSSYGQWIVAIIGYVCIVYIMFNGATRLEKRQTKRYGTSKEYQEYVSHTPILIPGIPLYHLYKE